MPSSISHYTPLLMLLYNLVFLKLILKVVSVIVLVGEKDVIVITMDACLSVVGRSLYTYTHVLWHYSVTARMQN